VKLLLDTHALLWWLTDDGQLRGQARDLVEDPGNDVLISMVSLWEIAVKTRVGKLEADIRQILDAVQHEGFTLLDIGMAHLVTLAELPMHHRDPFDHLLIAQAITEDATFISEDRNAVRYPVRMLTCSGTTST
jgi:PIN domain nuclease of toxin-antitoxin system